MINKIDYKIPSWKKVDLHIHSPASLNTIVEPEIKKYLAERKISLEEIRQDFYFCDYWVDDLVNVIRKTSLNIISITDHNWFSKKYYLSVKNKLESEKINCNIFPGVEIDLTLNNPKLHNNNDNSSKHLHCLMIFENDEKTDLINELDIFFKKERKKYDIEEIVKHFSKYNYFFIPHSAHKDKKHGIEITSESASEYSNYFKSLFFPAMEGNQKLENVLMNNFIDSIEAKSEISDKNFVPPAICKFSDCHNILEYEEKFIKKHTYFRMTNNFSGFKVSFLTFSKRIKINNNIPINTYLNKIKSIEIKFDYKKNGKHAKEIACDSMIYLSPYFNAVIGFRSSGKSLLLHSLAEKNVTKSKDSSKMYKYFGENNINRKFTNLTITLFDENNKEINYENFIKNTLFYPQDKIIESFFEKGLYDDFKYLFDNFNEKIFVNKIIDNTREWKKLAQNINDLENNSDSIPLDVIKLQLKNSFKLNNIKYGSDSLGFKEREDNIQKIGEHFQSLSKIGEDSNILELDDTQIEYINSLKKHIDSLLNIEKKKQSFFLILNDSVNEINLLDEKSDAEYIKLLNFLKSKKEYFMKVNNYITNNEKDDKTSKELKISDKRIYVCNIICPVLNKNNIFSLIECACPENKNDVELTSLVISKISSLDKKESDALCNKISNVLRENRNISFKEILKDESINEEDIDTMSEGRKSLAILEIIISSNTSLNYNLIVVDQPEDNMDNRDIYKILVPQLLNSNKQIIFSSHDSNVVINGDAEVIIDTHIVDKLIKYDNLTIENSDDVEKICSLLEGGKRAFEFRGIKYDVEKR